MDKLHLIAKYLMKNEKIDGVNFEKLMKGELTEFDFSDNAEEVKTEQVSDINVSETPTVDDSEI